MNEPPLIAHLIFRLDFGGLENGLVNLINTMPVDKYRHVVICVSDYTDFKNRIQKANVDVYALHKNPGHDLGAYFRLWTLLRKLKPAIIHSRNLGTIEYVIPSMLAGVKYRIHGEHGRDMTDIDGTNKKYQLLRRLYGFFLDQFIALSKDLENWLIQTVGIAEKKVYQIYNGVDLTRFQTRSMTLNRALIEERLTDADILIGTVGRLQAEKDQTTLLLAFSLLLEKIAEKKKAHSQNVKLVIIGDGPDRKKLEALALEQKIADKVIFLGARNDIPDLLAMLDIFVLPSRGEGISNTILEAMASQLPVVATNVGGNPELVEQNVTGQLVFSNDPNAMTEALMKYVNAPTLAHQHGIVARKRVEAHFSLTSMVEQYVSVYDAMLPTVAKEQRKK